VVNRALFLLKHCGVAPGEMLLLAFNRKAALEIRRRLLSLLHDGDEAAIAADVDRRIREAGKHKSIDRDGVEANAVDAVATKLNPTSATRAKKIGKLLILRSRIFKGRHYTLDFWVRR
jgi:DNA helicase IV